jgi:hypothetical protein
MKIIKRYEWKELTRDGLLKDIADTGPYYEKGSLNEYGGFESVDKAVEALTEWDEENPFTLCGDITLITFYSIDKE